MNSKTLPDNWVTVNLEKAGVDLDRLAQLAPALFDQVFASPGEMTIDDQIALLNECAEISGDNDFGLHLADHLKLTSIGTYGYLLLNAPTLGEFLDLAVRYYPLVDQSGRLRLSTSGDSYRLEFISPHSSELDARHLIEWTIGFFAKFIRAAIDDLWLPSSAAFANTKPSNTDELRLTFGDNLAFETKTSWFEFDSNLLKTPISPADPVLMRIFSRHADDLVNELGKKNTLRAEIQLLIMEGLEAGKSNANFVARKLNMSLSSLKRRLSEDGLSFRQLRDSVLLNITECSLSETNLPLNEIARKVGYSELSAFTRAFTRLAGIPPLAYRKSSRARGK